MVYRIFSSAASRLTQPPLRDSLTRTCLMTHNPSMCIRTTQGLLSTMEQPSQLYRNEVTTTTLNMTLRHWAAGHVLPALVLRHKGKLPHKKLVEEAIRLGDALIEGVDKEK